MNGPALSSTDRIESREQKAVAISHQRLLKEIGGDSQNACNNLQWLQQNMPPYFFITMRDEKRALKNLAWSMSQLACQRRLVLDDQPDKLILARLDRPGSLYDTLMDLRHRAVSYAEMTHSVAPLPGNGDNLEIQRLEFDLQKIDPKARERVTLPTYLQKAVSASMRDDYPDFDFSQLTRMLRLLLLNNPSYAQVSPPVRIARGLWMYQQAEKRDGLFFHLEKSADAAGNPENRLLFSVLDPPEFGYLAQISEIFRRLEVGIRRLYCLSLKTGEHTAMLGSFYVAPRNGQTLESPSGLYRELKAELYNTRLLSNSCRTYQQLIGRSIMLGQEASLINAFIAFCHTSLAHWQPDRFDREVVKNAFCTHPEIVQGLLDLFRQRFDPEGLRDQASWEGGIESMGQVIRDYNTGHRNLDEVRRTIFQTCLLFVKHTLKTNYFVREKQALAFRLDPRYLKELDPACCTDLPKGDPFRITFFFTREGFGYHIGFSDIARGGWRTIISNTEDEYTANGESLFREAFVLAHTQHLKNKDIYEGGSKMVLVMDARHCDTSSGVNRALLGFQRAVLNSFLDLFTTQNGRAANSGIVDYYGDDEPIELGPDENMGDSMIEHIAQQSVRRGYVLGVGLISSKRQGINHKEYGVTSLGVVKTAILAMTEMGLEPDKRPFTVRFTGGPGGDVAGNAMRRLIDHHPLAKVVGVVDGPGILCDQLGADPVELRRLTLKKDISGFDPEKLNLGGYLAYKNELRQEGLRKLHRMVVRTGEGLEEKWITADEYQRLVMGLTFVLKADLFLPCGGRPETIDDRNWTLLFDQQGEPSVPLIVEGANSFLTPRARIELQKKGITILRDATANKCGVIASSYEIIANLLMSEREFERHKEQYVKDVLTIIERRSGEETALIFERWRANIGSRLFTEISSEISGEINDRYAELFQLFQSQPDLANKPIYRKAMLNHLPAIIGSQKKFRSRLSHIPFKIKCAILASEIASMITYKGGWEGDLGSRVAVYLKEVMG